MQHLTKHVHSFFASVDSGGRTQAVRLAPDVFFFFFLIQQKKDPCNPSILEAKKILIRRAITRARGKSPLMKFPVDHMQFVSSQ